MKQIRTIKYIDMFVPTNDFKEDHLIDITREPYYKKITDVTQNTFNICEIIYKKSLDYGFPISKAIDFSKNAGLAHLENNPNADVNDFINEAAILCSKKYLIFHLKFYQDFFSIQKKGKNSLFVF